MLKEFEQRCLFEKWVEPGVDFHAKKTIIHAPIAEVSSALARQLKPDRELISVMKVSDGKLEEITDLTKAPLPTAVATTVARPVAGCPPTEFDAAEIKAREVLSHFLSSEQLADFERFNKFIAVGVDTGHRYMVTSRHAKDRIAKYQRTLYDLETRKPYCAHDWSVPPAEEMLALFVCISLPGREIELRSLKH